jgi:hypothetical protein
MAPAASSIPTTAALAVGIAAPALIADTVITLPEGSDEVVPDVPAGPRVIRVVTTGEETAITVVGGTSTILLSGLARQQ